MAARVRKPPSRQIPCRVMSKSVDNEEHSYVPDTESIPKFDGVSGCKITQKNKCMGDYRYIYPMLDPDGKTRLITERDFHQRIRHKYRHFEGYDYIYPVLTSGIHEGKRSDLISAPKVDTCFVPEEVDRMIPQGVEQILTDYDTRSLLFIASRRGDIYPAGTKKIPFRETADGDTTKPNIKSVSELNEEAEPKPTKKQLRDIDRWKKQMEELNRFGSNLSGNRVVYFGCEVNREEWRDDDDIMSWFAENYPEDSEDVNHEENGECIDGDETEDVNIECNGECNNSVEQEECAPESLNDDCDSGYGDNQQHPCYHSQMSSESVNSDDFKQELEGNVEQCKGADSQKTIEVDHGIIKMPSQGNLTSRSIDFQDENRVVDEYNVGTESDFNYSDKGSFNRKMYTNEIADTSSKESFDDNISCVSSIENNNDDSIKNNEQVSLKAETGKVGICMEAVFDSEPHSNKTGDSTNGDANEYDKRFQRNNSCSDLTLSFINELQNTENDNSANESDVKVKNPCNHGGEEYENDGTLENHEPGDHHMGHQNQRRSTGFIPGKISIVDMEDDHTNPTSENINTGFLDMSARIGQRYDENDLSKITKKRSSLNDDDFSLGLISNSLKTRQDSESTDNYSTRSDIFFDAEEAQLSETCSDGFRTPERKEEVFGMPEQSISENIAQLVKSISHISGDGHYYDSNANDSCFMDEIKSENDCARSLKNTREKIQKSGDIYEAILDFQPLSSDKEAIPIKEGQEVEVLDDSSKPRRWFVRTRPFQDAPGGVEGWVPSCYLEKKMMSRLTAVEVTKEYTDPKEKEAASKRAAVVKELVETEEDFSRDMQYVVRNYIKEMNSTSMPSQLRDHKDALFSNFKEISEFHNNELIKGVQYYANEPAKLGVTFLRLERDFDKHANYCKNEPDAQALLASTPLKQRFDEVSKKIGDDKTLSDHLKLPIQRINDYQLLLKELIKYTARLQEDTTDLDRALEFLQTIPQKAANEQLLKSIQGYKGNIHKFGQVLKHDWFDVTEGTETKERYVFLFKGRMCITEVKKTNNKDSYSLKRIVKLHQATIEEGKDNLLTLNHPTESGFPFKMKARSTEQKDHWVKELTTTAIPFEMEDLGEDEPVVVPETPEVPEQVSEPELKASDEEALTPEPPKSEPEPPKSEPESPTPEIPTPEPQIPEPATPEPPETPIPEPESSPIPETPTPEPLSPEPIEPSETLIEPSNEEPIVVESPEPQETVLETKFTREVETKVEVLEDFEAYEEGKSLVTESIRSGSITSIDEIQSPFEDETSLYSTASEAEAGKPRFIKPIRGVIASQGESGTFSCEIAGATNVSWLKGTQPVKTSSGVTVVVNGNHHSLVFKELKQEDVSLYTVVAANEAGTISCSAQLDVKGGLDVPKVDSRPTTPGGSIAPHAPVFKVMLKDTELLENTSVRFEIVVRGQPEPKVTFFKNGKKLKEDDRVRVILESKEAYELVMDHVVTEDSGKYSCEAKNSEGKAVTEGNISVIKHKVLFQGLEDELEPVKTPSPVPPVFKWFKDGSEFEASERFQVSFDDSEDTLALVFHHVKPEDAGLYTCVASTCSGRIACSAELTVQGLVNELLREPEAPEIKARLSDVEVSEGASAMLEVKVTGFPKPVLTWYHGDDDVIEAGGRFKFLFEDNESISLVIKNVTKEDAGVYRVIAKNELGEAASSALMTVTCPPAFRKPLSDTSVNVGAPVKLQVEVDGQPEPEIKWFKDGQPLSGNDRVKMSHPRGEIFILNIDKAKIEDAGNYSCVVTNPHGSQTGFGALSVNAPPSFVRGLKSVEVSEDETASLSVKVAGSPKPAVKWSKDGKEIKETKRIKIKEEETNTYILIIEKTTKEDAGEYTCDIKNDLGSDSSSGNLGVKGKPSFSKKLTDMEFREGDSEVSLDVKAEGTPKPKIKWLKDDKEVKEDSNIKIKSDDEKGAYSLTIKKVTSDVGGSYTCQATNPAGKATTSGTVSVNAAPKILEGLKDTNGALDQDASFTLKFKGHPKPDVKWTKDGASLTIDHKHVTVKEEASDQLTLIIHKIVDSDKGVYGCEISNQYGKDSSTGTLKLQGKPVFTKTLEDIEVREGDTNIDLEIKVEGSPEPTIKWSLNGKDVAGSDTVKLTSDAASGSHKLTLKKVDNSAAGVYKCTATNPQGSADTSATFTVLSKPKFSQGLKDAEVNEGEAISLTVKVEGKPVPDISWRHNGEDVSAEATIRIKKESDFVHLIEIDNATITLSGDYECKASSSLGEATTKSKLTVNSKPVFEKTLKDKEVWTEEETIFEVKVKGSPEPKVSWFKDGKEITKSDRVKIISEETTHKLVITKTKMEDSATYKCAAKNKAGEASSEASLSVKSADDSEAPTFIRKMVDTLAVEGDAARFEVKVAGKPTPTVTWFRETKEVIESKTIIIGSDAKDSTFTLTLKDLTIKDTAEFSCKAVNEKGEATDSAKLTVKEPVAPGIEGMSDVEVKLGGVAKFEVKTTGLPKPEVKWFKDGSALKASDTVVITSDDETQTYSLAVRNVKEDNLGTYSCKASNSAGKAESKGQLGLKPEAPTVLKDLKDATTKPGEKVKFDVRFGGYPVPTVTWFKGDTALENGAHYKISQKDDCFFLEVVGVTPDDLATYTSKAKNKAGEASSTAVLRQQDSAPVIEQPLPKKSSVVEGEQLKLEAKVGGQPEPEVKWLKDGKQLKPDDRTHMDKTPEGVSKLEVDDVKPSDAGKYELVAKNDQGQAKSPTAVTVQPADKKSKPEFLRPLEPLNLTEGQSGKLEVQVAGNPKPHLTWLKNGEAIEPDGHLQVSESPGGSVALLIQSPTPEDAGKYACIATNEAGDATTSAPISVQRPPNKKPEFTQGLKPTSLVEGKPGRLEAKVSGEPKPAVKWLKDGKELSPNDHLSLTEEPDGTVALLFDKVTPEDAGKYAVVLTNDQGEAKSQAPVTVEPSSPAGKKGDKPGFEQPLLPGLFTEGEPGKLEAKVTGEPTPEVTWLKDGKPLSPSDHISMDKKPDGTISLNIDKVTPEDSGRYAVQLSSPAGENKSEAKVTTLPKITSPTGKKPDFERGLSPCDINEAEPLKLEAKVSADPKPDIKWLKDGEEIAPSNRIYMSQEPDGTVRLTIDHALPEDSGKYAVVATNPEGKTRSAGLVNVKAVPKEKPSISVALEPATLTAGQPGKLTAKFTGRPKPVLKWLKDGKEVAPDSRVKIVDEADGGTTLTIDSVVPEDAGKYTVVAANENGETRTSAPVTVNQPPIFAKPLSSADAIEGYPSKLEGVLTGEPKPELKWLKDGKNFKPDGVHVKSFQSPDGSLGLIFDRCIPQDSANYGCVASNPHGEASTDGDLSVKAPEVSEPQCAPSVLSPLSDTSVKDGEPIKFRTEVTGSPLPALEWYLDDQPVHPSDNIHMTFDGKKATLDIRKCNPQHAGQYECRATNALGTTNSKAKATVLEKSAPRFIQKLVDLEASSAEPLRLQCRVRGSPVPDIEWYFNGDLIEPGLKYNMSHEGDTCSLTLPHPRSKDSGRYECRARNSAGEDRCAADIKVSDKGEKGSPPLFLKKLGDCESSEGADAKFTACITGSPMPDIKWFRNGEQLDFGSRQKMELEPNGLLRLILRNLQPEDFGEYRLSISNPYGSDQCTGHLRPDSFEIKRRPVGDQFADFDKFKKTGAPVPLPDKPRIIRMLDDNLTLSWKPSIPIYPRVPVTYQLEQMKLPDSPWSPYRTGIKDSICDVRGLEPGQDYRFRIRVENKFGVSDPSPYVTAHRSMLRPTSPGDYKPKDYEIDHPPLEKNAEAPRFLRKEEDTMYGVKGQPVSIEFWVYGYPQPEVTWFFNNEKMEKGKYDFLQDRNGQVIVFITRMTEADVGSYVCHAVNEHGDAKQKINLLIAETPVFTKKLEETNIMIRRSGHFECRVIGKPYPKIKWFKDWHPLHESSRIKITWTEPDLCSLFLSGSIAKDAGLYSCSATNIAGTAATSAMVSIEESESEHDLLTYTRPKMVKPRTKPFEDFYDIGDELGRGTQGITYHAVERQTGKSYAAKVMHGTGPLKDFMTAEMDIMNQLCHPNLVRLWDAFDTRKSLSLVTDLCGGGELLDHIINKGSLTESEVAHYIKQVLTGLEHMHSKNIGHLGLTVGDVLVTRLNGDTIKLGDFGLATRLHSGRNYIQLYGHPEFASPELVKKEPASLAADMWSVGVLTYLLLSGVSPFLGENDRETLTRVLEGKINFFHDGFAEVSDDARDFISKLIVYDPTGRLDVKSALNHPWLRFADVPDKGDNLNNLDRLKDYHKRWRDWYANASCRRYYRRRPMESCFTHPSKMIYPPNEEYTPPETPERDIDRTRVKPAEFDDTYQQKIAREPIDFRSESQYQSGPDTYLLQLRDTDFPARVRQYLRVGASRSPSLASNLREKHWGDSHVAVRERRRFVDIMDEEIVDEQKGLGTRTLPLRLQREIGTLGYTHEQIEALKKEAWKDKSETRDRAIGSIPFFRERIVDVVIKEDQEAVFSCLATGNPEPAYSWFRNDGILVISSRIQVKPTPEGRCELHLKPAKMYDMGVYKCVARNSHGVAICRARLKIGEVPGRPEAPEVNRCSDKEVYVVWAAPRFTGNCHIMGYCLESKQAGQEEWSKVADNIQHEFFVVKNLQPNTEYQFRIVAFNKFGKSLVSNPSEPTSTLPEGAPKITISRARKFQQAATERGGEIVEDIPEDLDYSLEQTPVELKTSGEITDYYNFVAEITRGRYSLFVKTWLKERAGTFVGKLVLTDERNEVAVKREVEILRTLCHKHIVRLESASFHENLTAIILERLSGVDILTYLASKHTYNEETVAKVIQQVLEGLDYLHFRGICYLELQPDNVVLVSQRKLEVKLVDFGSAQYVPKAGAKVEVKGTTEYLAPEIIKKEEVSAATDVWGVAVLTYILLSGVSPFLGENEEETANNVSYVRYRFENLHKEVTQEATRFLMHIFKRTPSKRPTIEECLEHKWLLPSEFLLKKREHAVFLAHRLHDFSEQFHSQKQASTPQKLTNMFGMSFTRSISLENDTYEEV